MDRATDKFLKIKNKSDTVGEIDIYGEISDLKFWGDEVTLRDISDELENLGDGITELEIHINSLGGDVFTGNAIFNVIDAYRVSRKVLVTVYNDGIMASMASGIAMVGDRIIAAENSLMMIHRPIAEISGNADDMRKAIEMLDKVEVTLLRNYMRHFKGTEEELRELMDRETWLTAEEALEYGLVTEVQREEIPIAALAREIKVGDVTFDRDKMTPDLIDRLHFDESEETTTEMEFLTKDAVVDAFGREMTAEELLDYAKRGIAAEADIEALKAENDGLTAEVATLKADNEAKAKVADKFEKVRQKAIDDLLANGIRAEGDSFNKDLYRKMVSDLEYEDIVGLSDDFARKAKAALNAGVRVSDPHRGNRVVENKDYSDVKNL